jgi:hypothetical protein
VFYKTGFEILSHEVKQVEHPLHDWDILVDTPEDDKQSIDGFFIHQGRVEKEAKEHR